MRFIAIIPARFASTRFPGKPLALLDGKPIIQRVYERVVNLFDETFVATDDERISQAVKQFGGNVIMTSPNHKSGTDRCWEAISKIGSDKYDVVINIQGDEPFVHPTQIQLLKDCFNNPNTQIATLVKPFDSDATLETLQNPNSPKVVLGTDMRALYFSRSIIPYIRGNEQSEWLHTHTFYKHLGLYAYKTEVLKEITQLQQSELEKAESLEQLRWLENGYHIQVGITNHETVGIDTPEDLIKAEAFLNTQKQQH